MKWKKMNLQLFADAHEQLQNTTGSSGMSAEMKTFYERRLIDQALPALVHDQFGDSYPIPANNGKTIEFRKYDALQQEGTQRRFCLRSHLHRGLRARGQEAAGRVRF